MTVQFLEFCTKFVSSHSLNGSSDSANGDLQIYLFVYLCIYLFIYLLTYSLTKLLSYLFIYLYLFSETRLYRSDQLTGFKRDTGSSKNVKSHTDVRYGVRFKFNAKPLFIP